jgi:cation:H+ antiporter
VTRPPSTIIRVWSSILLVAIGMVLLVVSAEYLIRSSVTISTAFGVTPLIVGLTVVAFGSSAPEMALSVWAAVVGSGGEIATGNIVGSSVANILLIIGLTAVVGALAVHHRLVRFEVPVLVVVTGAVWWAATDGAISRGEGAVLVVGLLIYIVVAYRVGQGEKRSLVPARLMKRQQEVARGKLGRNIGILLASLVGLIGGTRLTVDGASDLAAGLGVNDLLIGLTIVAVGTSLPELVTSVVAVRRNQADIAVGNVLGSNLFNLMGVFGVAAIVGNGVAIPEAVLSIDFPIAFLATLVALPVLASGLVVERWEGAVMLALYLTYVTLLVLDANGTQAFADARMGFFALMIGAALVMLAAGMVRRAPPSGPRMR